MALQDQPADGGEVHPAHLSAAAIAGICIGSFVALATVAVCVFKCLRMKNPTSRSHSFISKSAESGSILSGGTMSKSSSMRSSRHLQSPQSEVSGHDMTASMSSSKSSDLEMSQIRSEMYTENEKDKTRSPLEEIKDVKDEDIPKDEKFGKLHFIVKYNSIKASLMVSIVRANDLPVKNPVMCTSDPYVKLQLLPEKKHKVKTRVVRKSLNPVFDETFTFYGIDFNQLHGITLHFAVLSFDRYSRDDVIGEIVFPLAGHMELGRKELSLWKDITSRHLKIRTQGRGELLVSLCYQPAANRLTVVVLKARNLPKMDITGLSDPYVKIYILFDGQRMTKKKTHVKKRTLNPVYNESFIFDIPGNEGLHNISLEFHVLDWDRVTKNEIIGRLELGARSVGDSLYHWNEVVACPRKQIAQWHKLKD